MTKIAASLFAGSTAFVIGTLVALFWSGSLSYLRADESLVRGAPRSCQVKEVDLKGRVVWMTSAEWLRQTQ